MNMSSRLVRESPGLGTLLRRKAVMQVGGGEVHELTCRGKSSTRISAACGSSPSLAP